VLFTLLVSSKNPNLYFIKVAILKHFLSAHDVPDINALVKRALAHKALPQASKTLGAGKRIGLLFLNPSMRTRLSTQVAAQNLGMEAIVFNIGSEGWALEFEDGATIAGLSVAATASEVRP
jgi:N-succinyl-L-ornithine transcarbamylase